MIEQRNNAEISTKTEVEQVEKSNTNTTFRKQIGGTTYIIGVYFNENSKETFDDKIQRLVLRDCDNL